MVKKEKFKTLSQERALFVMKRIDEHKRKDKFTGKNYKSYSAKLPAMIVSNGLAGTLAFMNQASGKEWKYLYDDLQVWFQYKGWLDKEKDLLERVLEVDAMTYRRMTREAIALSEWLKRLASVEFKSEKET